MNVGSGLVLTVENGPATTKKAPLRLNKYKKGDTSQVKR